MGSLDAVENDIHTIRHRFPDAVLSFSSEDPLKKLSYYYASARFLNILHFHEAFDGDFLLTDIDLRWHTRPEEWLTHLGNADVGMRIFDRARYYTFHKSQEIILRYPRTALWECTSASSVFLRGNAAGAAFARVLSDIASQHLESFLTRPGSHWFIDQNILSAVYAYVLRHRPEVRIGNLDEAGTAFDPYSFTGDNPARLSWGQHWIADADELLR